MIAVGAGPGPVLLLQALQAKWAVSFAVKFELLAQHSLNSISGHMTGSLNILITPLNQTSLSAPLSICPCRGRYTSHSGNIEIPDCLAKEDVVTLVGNTWRPISNGQHLTTKMNRYSYIVIV